ncbi:MAG: hypothetical protein ABJN04_15820 [Hyphomicrobiales bacterium]
MIEWFNSVLGEAVGTYAAIGVGLLIVIVLIIILLRVLRSFTGGMFGNKSQNRLGVIEAAAVDNKRRLVLVRRDNVEHLIMIGGTSDILVEAGINRSTAGPRPSQPPAPTGAARMAATPTPAAPTPAPAPTQSAAPQAAAQRAPTPATPAPAPVQQAPAQQAKAPAQQAPAPKPAAPVAPQPTPAAQPQQAAVPPKTTTPVITPPSDSAKVGNDMDRLLNQIAGDSKG